MNDKKNIERLFQEKFKDFESTPPKDVWNNIETSLDKKSKKRNVIPIWWKLGGAAAALALIFILNGLFLDNSQDNDIPGLNNPITDKNDSIKEKKIESLNNKPNKSTQDAIVETENENVKTLENSNPKKGNTNTNSSTTSKTSIASSNDEVKENETKAQSSNDNKSINKPEGIYQNNKTEIAHNKENNGNSDKDSTEKNNAIAESTIDKQQKEDHIDDDSNKKRSLLDVVAEMEKEKGEEVLASSNDKKPTKWTVNPNIAPVYYNSLSKGSPINADFSNNTKNGDVNMSYGINIAYNVSKRLSVRSGVNSVNMGYTTNNVDFGPSVFSAQSSTSNITFKNSSTALNVSDQKTPSANFNDEIQAKSDVVSSGSMDQKFGYLEIPMELKYRLVDKRFGVNLIGGFSSLFLTNNEVSFETNDNLATEVGEANNLNDLSFSTNIGLGVDYKVTDKLLFNLEPMFKYQLNTFSREGGGFNPYLLGVYTGLSFKF